MRFVQVTVPGDDRDDVLEVLEDEGIDFVVTEAMNDPDYGASITFPLPTEAVEPVLHRLGELDIEERGHAVILAAETVVSKDFEELQREYDADEDAAERVAFEELRTNAWEFVPEERTFVLLSIVSAVVAVAGLLLDAPAMVVGAMVIAPLIGPAMATSVGTVLSEDDLFWRGVRHQVVGYLLVVASATVFAGMARALVLVPPTLDIVGIEQIAGRLTPDLLTLAIAVGSGIAGARSLSTDVSTGLVGVMIAAALVPPAAAVGIGIAWMIPAVVVNAGIQVAVNVLAINLAAMVTLRYAGYRPTGWLAGVRADRVSRRRVLVLGVAILAVSAVLATFTVGAYRASTTDRAVHSAVDSVLDERAYDDLTLVDTEVRRDRSGLGRAGEPTGVIVTVARPTDARYPSLAERLAEQIERDAGISAEVTVRYVEVDRAG